MKWTWMDYLTGLVFATLIVVVLRVAGFHGWVEYAGAITGTLLVALLSAWRNR